LRCGPSSESDQITAMRTRFPFAGLRYGPPAATVSAAETEYCSSNILLVEGVGGAKNRMKAAITCLKSMGRPPSDSPLWGGSAATGRRDEALRASTVWAFVDVMHELWLFFLDAGKTHFPLAFHTKRFVIKRLGFHVANISAPAVFGNCVI
jgi:hypothetical protein